MIIKNHKTMKINPNPYIIDGSSPKMRRSLYVYMDILGFRKKHDEARKINKLDDLFIDIQNKMTTCIELLKDDDDESPLKSASLWQYKIFSDNIILGCPIDDSSDGESEYSFIVSTLHEFQMQMVLSGLFIRGGLTYDEVYISEEIVFGPALIEAYDIEQTIARDPRIILSKKVLALVRNHLKYYARSKDAPQNRELLKDTDKQVFLNYLDICENDDSINWGAIQEHKENVENKLIEHKNDPKIYSKYLWVANYHNYFCKTHIDWQGYNNNYKIDSKYALLEPEHFIK